MSPDFSVTASQIRTAGQCLGDSAAQLSGLRLEAPDPLMYGILVGSAATDAEPATTEDINRLLRALGRAVDALSARAEATCAAYESVESDNAGLAGGIGGALSGGGAS